MQVNKYNIFCKYIILIDVFINVIFFLLAFH